MQRRIKIMVDGNSKVCPLIRQQCIRDRCEFFHGALKKCEVSVISYNAFRLAASGKSNTGNRKSEQETIFSKTPLQDAPWNDNAL
jgi:hypothetical protein